MLGSARCTFASGEIEGLYLIWKAVGGDEASEGAERLYLDASGPEVADFQKQLNVVAQDYFGLSQIDADGELGTVTFERYRELTWLLGVQDERIPVTATEVSAEALATIQRPAEREDELIYRAMPRTWNVGPEMTPTHVVLGSQLLALIGDWDSWVNRRVDNYRMTEEDPSVVIHRSSVDFRLPQFAAGGRRLAADLRLGGFPVPVAFDAKWRLRSFDLRDESGCSVSLLAREQQTPIVAGVLIAYAHYVMEGAFPPSSKLAIPLDIQHDLRAIVNEERDTAVDVCARLGEDRPADGPDTALWRAKLASDRGFMELAQELAQTFLVLVACSDLSERRVLKISREEATMTHLVWAQAGKRSIDFKRPGPWRTTVQELRRLPRALSGGKVSRPLAGYDPGPREVGEMHLSCVGSTQMVGSRRSGGDDASVVAKLKLTGHPGVFLDIKLKMNSAPAIRGLPVGTYDVRFEPLDGVRLIGSSRQSVEVRADVAGHATVRCSRFPKSNAHHAFSDDLLRRPSRLRRLQQGIGWRSKLMIFAIRVGNGGSYHFEFEAPPGIQVTRAKLVDDSRGLQDLIKRGFQRTNLYVPRDRCDPATAYALLNIRPRAETVVRTATLTALFAFAVLVGLALEWWLDGRPGSAAPAFLLAVPGGLSAYMAQSVPNRVTAEWLYGLRLAAIAPGVLCFAGAALLIVAKDSSLGLPLFGGVTVASGLVLLSFMRTWRWVTRPPEQSASKRAQGPAYARRVETQEAGVEGVGA